MLASEAASGSFSTGLLRSAPCTRPLAGLDAAAGRRAGHPRGGALGAAAVALPAPCRRPHRRCSWRMTGAAPAACLAALGLRRCGGSTMRRARPQIVSELRVPALRRRLQELGLDSSGTRAELLRRLQEGAAFEGEASGRVPMTAAPRAASSRARAPEAMVQEVIRIIGEECPSYDGAITLDTPLAALEADSDSLDVLEATMALEEHFNRELDDDCVAEVTPAGTVQDLADLLCSTPQGMRTRSVSDEIYDAMVRRTHSENRWGQLDLLSRGGS